MPVSPPAEPSAEAAWYLAEHFITRVSRWKGDDRGPPNRLVYLLDHEYTSRHIAPSTFRPVPVAKRSSVAATFSPRRRPLTTDTTADPGR